MLIIREVHIARIGEVIGENYYVLPSSVHETLIIPDNGSITLPELSAMVHEVNENEVSAEDRLSDKFQYFDRETGVLENAQKREMRLEKAKEERSAGKKKGIHAKLEAGKEKAKKQEKKEPAKHKDKNIDL